MNDDSTTSGLPWTHSCFVCGQDNPLGFRLKSRLEGRAVVLDYAPRPEDVGWRGLVHGGLAMTLLDEVMTWAAILEFRGGCVAAECAARFRKALVPGNRYRVEGRAVRSSPRLVATEGRVFDAGGEVMVAATGKYMPMKDPHRRFCETDFVTGPGTLDPRRITAQPERP